METIKGYTLTKEETDACFELVQKMRTEREHKRMIALHYQLFKDLVTATIDAIGIVDTKQIIRRINRELRGVEGVSPD